jgi:hypothetical protein
MKLGKTALVAAALVCVAPFAPAQAGGHHGHGGGGGGGHDGDDTLSPVVALDGPRGVDTLGHGTTLVTEADGTFSLVVERRHRPAKVIKLGSVPAGVVAPAISAGPGGAVYLLTGGGAPGTGAATLYVWHWGDAAPTPVLDVGAYQHSDPDPYNLADDPGESNPFGLAALKDGTVLVADAAGNDLIRVWADGHAVTVARLRPRVVTVPDGLPATDPEGNPLPPAGTPLDSEAVATSVTVGPDGYWYVGELRGFPATPGTSQIWRIKPGSVDAVCDPATPWSRGCSRYADGLTSVVDLGADRRSVYAVTLSKLSWLAFELGVPGSQVGGLFRVSRSYGGARITELVPDQLVTPGGVDVDDDIYVTGPVMGPGALSIVD